MTNIKELVDCFQEAVDKDANYIGVLISMPGFEKPELIINPYDNFESKLEYYLRAYNEDLTLKTFNQIKIITCAYGHSLDELNNRIYRKFRRIVFNG